MDMEKPSPLLIFVIDCSIDVGIVVEAFTSLFSSYHFESNVLISLLFVGVEIEIPLNVCSLEKNKKKIINTLALLRQSEDSDLEQGLVGACMYEIGSHTVPIFVIISNGIPTLGVTDSSTICRAVELAVGSMRQTCTLNCIGVGISQDSHLLSCLSQQSEGSYHFSPNSSDCLTLVIADVLYQVETEQNLSIYDDKTESKANMLLTEYPPPIKLLLEAALVILSHYDEEIWLQLIADIEKESEVLQEEQRCLLNAITVISCHRNGGGGGWILHVIRSLISSKSRICTLLTLTEWIMEQGRTCTDSASASTSSEPNRRSRPWLRYVNSADPYSPPPRVTRSPREIVAGRFEVSRSPVGKGAYGSIYIAVDLEESDKEVAVKKISDVNRSRSSLVLGLRELRTMKLLAQHPNIVSLYGAEVKLYGHENNQADLWVAMELLSIDLQQLIDSNQVLSDRHHSCILFQLLCGVQHMHRHGVIHRDLKPGNILLDAECNLRICDFGLARCMEEESIMTEYVVTRWYRAFEVLQTQTYGPPVDVWSIGCIFSELVHRRPLFPGRDPAHQLHLIANTELVDSDLDDTSKLTNKMLNKDPSKRIKTWEALTDNYFTSRGLNYNPIPEDEDVRFGGEEAVSVSEDAVTALTSQELLERLIIEAQTCTS